VNTMSAHLLWSRGAGKLPAIVRCPAANESETGGWPAGHLRLGPSGGTETQDCVRIRIVPFGPGLGSPRVQ
jgi:hypothetical protein